MSRVRTMTRRSVLIGSAAVLGGVAFGAYRYHQPYDNPLKEGLPQGAAALTPYVMITDAAITLITPHADKGQGAQSVQAALIAEELDVTLDQVRLDPGPPSPAYWNTALSEEAALFLAPGALNGVAHLGLDAAIKLMGLQLTGGSTTVADSFEKLRLAGAVARETLKQAAAEQLGVARADLRSEAGHVIAPDGNRLPYQDLARSAAILTPIEEVELRPPEKWRLIGQPMQRTDIVAKSTGTQRYGLDLQMDGMLYAALQLNPARGGTLRSFDATEALSMRGVKTIVPVTGGVAVIADNTWRAFKAAEALAVQWGPNAMPATMDAHWTALDAAFTPAARDSQKRDDGDVEAALGETPIEAEYRAPYLPHAPLEPLNATVRVGEDAVDVWSGTQIPRFVQANLARITGFDESRIRIHNQMIGGSFGLRLEDEVIRIATEIALQMRGTPIKLTYSREIDMQQDYPRQIAMARMRGAVADGRVLAYDLSIASPSVISSQMARQSGAPPGPDSQIVAGAWEQPFAIPHHRVTGYRAEGLSPVSSWRSVGASTNGFFYNAGLDELIHAAGADPLEERLRLCNDPLALKVLEAVGEMSDWTGPTPRAGLGRGIALTTSFGVPCAEVVEVKASDAGLRITSVWVVAEVGRVVDPVNFENNVQGGVIWGLGHAIMGELTFTNGIADQENFDSFESLRLSQSPTIAVQGLENGTAMRGIGEPPVPPAAPALAGAIFALTGTRLRQMPFNKTVDFA